MSGHDAREVPNDVITLNEKMESNLAVSSKVGNHLYELLRGEAAENGVAAVADGRSWDRPLLWKLASTPRAERLREAFHGLELLR
jgi:hypothetical protein